MNHTKATLNFNSKRKLFSFFIFLLLTSAFFHSCDKDIYNDEINESLIQDRQKDYYIPKNLQTDDANSALSSVLTAAEWNDLRNWNFWLNLIQSDKWSEKADFWQIRPTKRYSIKIVDLENKPASGITVKMLNEVRDTIWTAKTDSKGNAELWHELFYPESKPHKIIVEFKQLELEIKAFSDYNEGIIKYKLPSVCEENNNLDIMMVVDATGSMDDKIDYLKNELYNLISRVKHSNANLNTRLGAVFYRDFGEEYVIRNKKLTSDIESVIGFIKEQSANGGGDYPEVVDKALETALYQSQWSEKNSLAKILFLMLDAPPRYSPQTIAKMQKCLRYASSIGVKIIPVAASGTDKDIEFLLRFFAIATNGTFTFLTSNTSFETNPKESTIGDYRLEFLNDLMYRLIQENCEK